MPVINSAAAANLSKIKATGSKGGWLPILVTALTLFEGFAPVGHHDPIDPPGVNTACFGHIEGVEIGVRYTKVQCQEMLRQDIPRYVDPIRKCLKVDENKYPWRFAAIVSAGYNLGPATICKSTAVKLINEGNIKDGCHALTRFVKSNGEFRQGLLNRRQAEEAMCLMGAAEAGVAPVPVPTPAPLPKDQIDIAPVAAQPWYSRWWSYWTGA